MTTYAGWTESEDHARERFERRNRLNEQVLKQREEAEKSASTKTTNA